MSTAPPPADRGASKDRWGLVKAAARWLLLLLGVGAVVALVMDAGPAAVWATLLAAGAFLPLVALGEVGFIGMDVISLRLMFGEHAKKVPLAVWLRSAMMAYGIMILLPAGRAGGEVARAAGLATYVGGARAAAGAAVLQGVTLWGNTLISIPCWIAVAMVAGAGSSLGLLVLGNGVVTGVIGSVLLLGARSSKIGAFVTARVDQLARWLAQHSRMGTVLRWRIRRWNRHGAKFDESLREMGTPLRPIVAAFLGRVSQTVQYGVILLAVGGSLTVTSALVAQSIHLVGAGLGDMVPNQVGITEGAYRVFASFLGLEDAVAQAIAIALVHRIVQFSLAGISLAVCAVWKPREDDAGVVTEEPA
ncbi:MAG: lysylphosphatidylglycerol synthase domain-containing protein [Sandaracinaceae bacterium]